MKTATRFFAFAGITIIGFCAAQASADTLTAQFASKYAQSISIDAPGHYNGSVNTVTFGFTRTDSPGPGVDSSVPITFDTFCIDLDQTISPGTNYTFQVLSLNDFGLSSNQITWLSRLWGTFKYGIDSATKSAAFQAAVWELRYDTDNDLSTGAFKMTSNSNVSALAQSWVNTVVAPNFSGGTASLVALKSATNQDQLAQIPSAGSAPLLAIASLLAVPRRRILSPRA